MLYGVSDWAQNGLTRHSIIKRAGPCLLSGRFSNDYTMSTMIKDRKCKHIYIISMWINDRKCRYIYMILMSIIGRKCRCIFIFPESNSACKGLIKLKWQTQLHK